MPLAAHERFYILGPTYWYKEVVMKYNVTLYQSEEGFSVWVPGLPGCVSQGETEEAALANIADAIQEYLAVVMGQCKGAEMREIEVAGSYGMNRRPAPR